VNLSSDRFKHVQNGFTLIELLVSVTISAVLLLGLAAIIDQTTDGYAKSQRSVQELSQIRALTQLIESELSTRMPETPFVHISPNGEDYENSDQIAFVRTLDLHEQDRKHPGDLTTHCYYVAIVTGPDRGVCPKLFRKVLNPLETQSFIENQAIRELPPVDHESDEAVIDHVLGFRATPKFFNVRTGEYETWNETMDRTPEILELTIRWVDEATARRFTRVQDWNRLSMSPRKNERHFIRTFHHVISIGS
jgi:prepilin-type N-terminal cleavage/methylation domain-containing protein